MLHNQGCKRTLFHKQESCFMFLEDPDLPFCFSLLLLPEVVLRT